MRLLLCLLLSAVSILAGNLTERFNLTAKRILKEGPPVFDENFILADADAKPGRRFTEFSGDVSGRYIGALALASRQSGERYPILDRVVTGAIKLQQPDGHFGAPLSTGAVRDGDMATLWGNGRMLIGLLEYYDLTHRADVLVAARKLGDFLLKSGPRFNSEETPHGYNGEKFAVGYICWTNSLEGLVEFVSGDQGRTISHPGARYRSAHGSPSLAAQPRLSHHCPRRCCVVQSDGGEAISRTGGGGLAGSYRFGERPGTRRGAEMFAPQIKRDEGCSEADWLRLSLQLWDLTRQSKYMQQAQITLFNEIAMNQFHTGDFGHHMLSEAGLTAPFAHAWWCCTFHGLRALAAVFQSVFHADAGALFYDLPVDGRGAAAGALAPRRIDARAQRDSTTERVEDGWTLARAARAIPEWASSVKLSLAGRRSKHRFKTVTSRRRESGVRAKFLPQPTPCKPAS